jgi:drug/metabolite transporter (DMT)-like permease
VVSAVPAARLTLPQIQLLLGLTALWGLNWPVMKHAVNQYPALHFRTLCMVLGMMAMWFVARQMKVSLRVPREHWGRIALLCIPNMIGWHLFCILGVKELSSGRAAILGYTMPVWAALSGLLFAHPVGRRGWVGLGLAMVAAALLLSSEFAAIAGSPQGVVLMLIAAACWGTGTTLIRHFPTGLHALTFTHAMMPPTIVVMGLSALWFEGPDVGLPETWSQWWPIFYNAFGVFAFCQVAWFSLAKALPPVVSSLSIMIIPVVGVMAGSLFLGEVPHWPDFAALVLILGAMAVILVPGRSKA